MTDNGKGRGCLKKAAIGCGLLLILPPVAAIFIISFAGLFNGRNGSETDYSGSPCLSETPPLLAEPVTLKLITYNIADAYLFTSNRPERIRAIGAKLTELDPDIVGFQEAFIEKDRALLYESLKDSRLQHHVRFPGATVGNGLLIMSAWPIEEAYFHRFEKSNPWYKIHEGDWWAGKGVGLARVKLPGGAVIDFYDTHAQAGRNHHNGYLAVRTAQLEGMARFINETETGSGPAFAVGDFNTTLDRSDMKTLIEGADLERIMAVDSLIDHIFAVRNPNYRFEVIETIPVQGRVMGSKGAVFLGRAPDPAELKRILFGPGQETSLSDHDGYMTTVRIVPVES